MLFTPVSLSHYAALWSVASPKENLKWLLGGKGAGLAQMASIGLPVPPGFTITTEGARHAGLKITHDS
eukprot:6198071-Pleurochrysis_carterae.AAC.1